MFFRFCIFWHAVGAAATGPAQLHVGGGGAGGGGGRAHRREVLGVAQVEGSRRRRRRVQRRAQLGRALRLCDGAALSAGSGRTAPERPRGPSGAYGAGVVVEHVKIYESLENDNFAPRIFTVSVINLLTPIATAASLASPRYGIIVRR